jgi:hypothetical protein
MKNALQFICIRKKLTVFEEQTKKGIRNSSCFERKMATIGVSRYFEVFNYLSVLPDDEGNQSIGSTKIS